MKSAYSDTEAESFVQKYANVPRDVALRVYTSRLIGRDDTLVMHGGGNTSVKAPHRLITGDSVEAIYVKGSGWNLDSIEPQGLPALDLSYLRKLRALPALSDEDMVNELRSHMFDAGGPNPSVETLLHAFLPHRFVDHSHSDAILAITNRPEGEQLCREIFGERVAVVPYIMPGFTLAKACAEAFERNPRVEGLVLIKHGFFTFGDSARESYERHIALVGMAEHWLGSRAGRKLTPGYSATREPRELAALVAPLLRGLLAEPTGDEDAPWRRMVMEWRATPEILEFVNSAECADLAATTPLTPDHVIRIKPWPCVVQDPDFDDPSALAQQLEDEITDFRTRYDRYFAENVERKGVKRKALDSFPRVVLVPGAGMFCFGPTKKDAGIAADLYEHTIGVKAQIHATSRYEALTLPDLFDMEYWPLEQAKLGKAKEKALARQIALITGAAGAIGSAIAARLMEEGCHVVLSDFNAEALTRVSEELGRRFGHELRRHVVADVSDEQGVSGLFAEAARLYGGVDIVIPNAGIALSKPIIELGTEEFERVQRVNSMGCFLVMREGARLLRRQATGGHIIVIGSKNVAAPGAEFAAYSASKAAAHQLAKVAALECAKDGIRVNVLAPDAVFGDEKNPSGLWGEVGPARARAHGIDPSRLEEHYRERNLLKARVTGRHVGNAVIFLATNQTPTTGAVLPIDGGHAQTFSR
jgi:rhamnulose-1-phosphate aldolase/alcohol dehydrogenase